MTPLRGCSVIGMAVKPPLPIAVVCDTAPPGAVFLDDPAAGIRDRHRRHGLGWPTGEQVTARQVRLGLRRIRGTALGRLARPRVAHL